MGQEPGSLWMPDGRKNEHRCLSCHGRSRLLLPASVLIFCILVCIVPVSAETLTVLTTPDNVRVGVINQATHALVGEAYSSTYDSTTGMYFCRFTVDPGISVTVHGDKDGYFPQSADAYITPGTGATVTLNLPAGAPSTMGALDVQTSPGGANVVVLSETLGRQEGISAPDVPGGIPVYHATNLPGGIYTVTVSKEGYDSYSMPVTVAPSVTTTINILITPNAYPGDQTMGRLIVQTSPNECDVQVFSQNGYTSRRGTSALPRPGDIPQVEWELPPGPYNIIVSKPGYEPFSAWKTVIVRQNVSINFIIGPSGTGGSMMKDGSGTKTALKGETGMLKILSTPDGASVFINGILQEGMTPMLIQDYPAGEYTVRVSQKGYGDYETVVWVKGGSVAYVEAALKPSFGATETTLAATPLATPSVALTTRAAPMVTPAATSPAGVATTLVQARLGTATPVPTASQMLAPTLQVQVTGTALPGSGTTRAPGFALFTGISALCISAILLRHRIGKP